MDTSVKGARDKDTVNTVRCSLEKNTMIKRIYRSMAFGIINSRRCWTMNRENENWEITIEERRHLQEELERLRLENEELKAKIEELNLEIKEWENYDPYYLGRMDHII